MIRLIDWNLDLIYPRDCMVCASRIAGSTNTCLCPSCHPTLPHIEPTHQCARCGNPLGPYAEGKRACSSCGGRSGFFFRAASAVCRYEGTARELVHHLKYGRDLRASASMADAMSLSLVRAPWFNEIDALVPVPLHWTRHLSRRFNQSEVLAHRIARECGRPVMARALRRVRRTESQARLVGIQRVENVRGVFRINGRKPIAGKRLLLIDDVMSTCATARECSRALMKAGAKAVYVAVYAR